MAAQTTLLVHPPIDRNATGVAGISATGQQTDAPRAKALPLDIRPQAYALAREALATENPLLYRDALHRIAHLAAFGPKGGRR